MPKNRFDPFPVLSRRLSDLNRLFNRDYLMAFDSKDGAEPELDKEALRAALHAALRALDAEGGEDSSGETPSEPVLDRSRRFDRARDGEVDHRRDFEPIKGKDSAMGFDALFDALRSGERAPAIAYDAHLAERRAPSRYCHPAAAVDIDAILELT